MWEYTVTTATGVGATQVSSSQAGTSTSSSSYEVDGTSGSESWVSATEGITVYGPYGTSVSIAGQYGLTQDGAEVLFVNWADRYTHGFSSSESRFTSAVSPGGVTTTSSSESAARTRDTFISGTEATVEVVTADSTTTRTTTRTVATGTTGGRTTGSTQTITQTTSTTRTSEVLSTIYATAATAALSGPERRVGVTEVGPNERAWEITATEAAGWAADMGAEFSTRYGTQGTSSMVAPVCETSETFMSVGWDRVAETLTVTTTATVSAVDTFVPWASVLPATATSTRSLRLLTTETATFSRLTYQLVGGGLGISQRGREADCDWGTQLALATSTGVQPVTINLSPTQTTTAEVHLTWVTALSLSMYRSPRLYATSSESSASESESGSFTTSVGSVTEVEATSTHTSTTTAGTSTNTETDVVLITTTVATHTTSLYEVVGFGSTLDTCAIPGPSVVTTSSSTDNGAGGTLEEYRATTHNAPELHTIAAETRLSLTYTETYTTTTGQSDFTTTFATTTETSETYTTTATGTTSVSTGSTTLTQSAGGATEAQAISVTYAQQHAHVTWDASVEWTAHQMHPRNGFRVPGYLAASLADIVALGLTANTTLYFPYEATQSDVAGPRTPIVDTVASIYSNGGSHYTAVWDRESTRLRYSSAVVTTYTTTAVVSAETQTVTRSSTVNATTGTLGVSGYSERSWYEAEVSSAASQGSRMGGMAARSDYAAALYAPAAVLHWTHQRAGTSSSSATSWLSAGGALHAAASTDGYALPTRNETARGAVAMASIARVTLSAGDVLSPFGRTEGDFGLQIVRPMVTLSQYPNL